MRENLNYSYNRLLEVFKSKFDTNNDHILTESEKNKAKEIANNPDLLIAVQPTRGLDVGAIEYVHSMLVKERDEGKAILLISLEIIIT